MCRLQWLILIITEQVTSPTASLCASKECHLAHASAGLRPASLQRQQSGGSCQSSWGWAAAKTDTVRPWALLCQAIWSETSAHQQFEQLDSHSGSECRSCKISQMGKSVLVYALISSTHSLDTTVTKKEMIFSMNQKLGVRSNLPLADRRTSL